MTNPLIFTKLLDKVGKSLLRKIIFSWAYLKALMFINRTPRILNFYSSEQLPIQGGVLKLVWRTKYVAFVHISGLGYFIKQSSVAFPIKFRSQSFTLTAYGFLKTQRSSIQLTTIGAPEAFDYRLLSCTPKILSITHIQVQPKPQRFICHSPQVTITSYVQEIIIPKPIQ